MAPFDPNDDDEATRVVAWTEEETLEEDDAIDDEATRPALKALGRRRAKDAAAPDEDTAQMASLPARLGAPQPPEGGALREADSLEGADTNETVVKTVVKKSLRQRLKDSQERDALKVRLPPPKAAPESYDDLAGSDPDATTPQPSLKSRKSSVLPDPAKVGPATVPTPAVGSSQPVKPPVAKTNKPAHRQGPLHSLKTDRPQLSPETAPSAEIKPPQPSERPPSASSASQPVADAASRSDEAPSSMSAEEAMAALIAASSASGPDTTSLRRPKFADVDRSEVQNPFAESVSGFFNLPDVDDSIDAPLHPLRRAATIAGSIAVGVVATGVAFSLCVAQWADPAMGFLYMAGGVLPPTLLGALVLVWPDRRKLSGRDILSAAAPALGVYAVALFLGVSWAVPMVRSLAFGAVPTKPDRIERVLEDPSESVAVRACERVAKFEDPAWRELVMSALTLRPTLAAECLKHAEPAGVAFLTAGLSDRWTRELTADDQKKTAERSCELSASLAELPAPAPEIDARLLYCSLNASNDAAQECCASTLAGRVEDPAQWARRIRSTVGVLRSAETAGALFAMAFHQKNLTAGQKRFAEQAKFSGDESQRVALELACDTVTTEGASRLTKHFGAALENTCPVDAGRLPESREVWIDVCAEAVRARTTQPREALCQATRARLTRSAAQSASDMIVMAARKVPDTSLSRGINLGFVKQSTERAVWDFARDEGEDDLSHLAPEVRQRVLDRRRKLRR